MSNPLIMDIIRNARYNLKQGLKGIALEQLSNVILLIDEKNKGLWDEISEEELNEIYKGAEK